MKPIIFAFATLLMFSCGKENTTSTPPVQGNDLKLGLLTLPAEGVYGGGPSLKYEGTDYQVDFRSSSSEVYNYVQLLRDGQSSVQAVSSTRAGKTYQVKFAGSFVDGQCTFNPSSVCTNASLQSIMAY